MRVGSHSAGSPGSSAEEERLKAENQELRMALDRERNLLKGMAEHRQLLDEVLFHLSLHSVEPVLHCIALTIIGSMGLMLYVFILEL